ncbi:MAG TPA: response regulator transcription factor [Solirubrobacteraceae bacterium]|nr:response regulator transcription factor [Solirubrobacteraceae bacterium]
MLLVGGPRGGVGALAERLRLDGWGTQVSDAPTARERAAAQPPDVVILAELGMPSGAAAFLVEARGRDDRGGWLADTTAIVVLGRHRGELATLRAFHAGADDYVAPPYEYALLRARLDSLARLAGAPLARGRVLAAPVELDLTGRRAWVAGRALSLRRREFDLLGQLASEPDRVFTREELLRSIWGTAGGATGRTLDSHASRLRRKLAGADRPLVINLRAVGYRLR